MGLDISFKKQNPSHQNYKDKIKRTYNEVPSDYHYLVDFYYNDEENIEEEFIYLDCVNITHNLGKMADALNIYQMLWHGENVTTAEDMIVELIIAISLMEESPDSYKEFDSKNGWGIYDHFLPWLKALLIICETHPEATISISR